MKKYTVFFAFSLVIATVLVTKACEQEKNPSEAFRLLTEHSWKYDSITTICQDPEIVEFVAMINNYLMGTIINFNADGSFKSEAEEGKWKFSNGETEIITFAKDDPNDILGHTRIDLLNENNLQLTDLVDLPPTDTCYLKSWISK